MKKYNKPFTLRNVSTEIIKKLNQKETSEFDDIPTKVMKEFGTFFAEFLSKNINSCLETGLFLEDLKCAEVVPIYKKNDKKDNSYYRKMHVNFDELLSKYQCGFRQGYGTQIFLLAMIEKLRKIRDKKGIFAAVLTDLSKAFECIRVSVMIYLKLN